MKIKFILTILFLLTITLSFSQKLDYESGGKVLDSNNKTLSPDEVREILSSKPELLENYNIGRDKKTIGNVLLGAGIGFIVGDLVSGATRDIVYPTAFTYIGIVATVISIPVKIGYSKKIKSAIEGYNKQVTLLDSKLKIEATSLYANQNGLGLRITF